MVVYVSKHLNIQARTVNEIQYSKIGGEGTLEDEN